MAFYEINWIVLLPALAGGSLLTLAAMNVALAAQREGSAAKGHLLFAVIAASAAVIGVFELLLANARTIDQYGTLMRLVHIPVSLLVLPIPWFVLFLFEAGRRWLAITANALWGIAFVINAFMPHSRLYDPITHIERVTLSGGAEFTWVSGPSHPGAWIGYAGVFALLVFVGDAAVTLWRRGEVRRFAIVGGCLGTSVAIGLVQSMLVETGVLRSPYILSVAFVFIMGGMAYEFVHDAVRVPVLERQVRVQEAEVAHLSRQSMFSEMSGGIAHELSQPLTAILSNAEAAISFLDRDSPDLAEVRGALQDIAEQDRHASEVVRGLARLLKKGERGSEILDLNAVVEEVLDLVKADLSRQAVAVSTRLASDRPRVRGDGVLLSLVVLNLVRNSAEAMAKVDPDERFLSVTTRVVEREVEVIISDRGSGIPEDVRDRVFDAFFTTRPDGSGLGLAVSRTLTELHGGRVWSESGPQGLGTAMHVVLPIIDGTST
jgi:signal transduction histidine kinase